MKGIAYVGAALLIGNLSFAAVYADQIGDKAKPLEIAEWVKGKKDVNVTDGKSVYVVEFWATWCGPCRTTIPHLTELQKEYSDKVVFVGISNEKAEEVKPFVEEQGEKMDYTVALDKENKCNLNYMRAYGQNGIPCAFIIDKEGRVAWVGHPMMMNEPLKQVVEGTYDLVAAIAADKLRVEIDNFKSVYSSKDPEKDKKFEQLLEKVVKNKNEESFINLLEVCFEQEDYDSCDKILDKYAQLGEEAAQRAAAIRKQIDGQRVLAKYQKALEDKDQATQEKLEKQLLEDHKDSANELLGMSLQLLMSTDGKSLAFSVKLLDAAEEAFKTAEQTPYYPMDFYRAYVYYIGGDIPNGDRFAAKAISEVDEKQKDTLSKQLDVIKNRAQKSTETPKAEE